MRSFLAQISTFIASTIGAGIFALPYATSAVGLIPAAVGTLFVVGLMVFVHSLYARVLEKDGNVDLVDTVSRYSGKIIQKTSIISSSAGLFFTLVVYLVLGSTFAHSLFPQLSPVLALLLCWLATSCLLFLDVKKFALFEVFGTLLIAGAICILFSGSSFTILSQEIIPKENIGFFLGIALFAFSSWTAIRPMMFENKESSSKSLFKIIIAGTFAVAILYSLFVLAVISASPSPSPDAFEGVLGVWSKLKIATFILLGGFAIWTSYGPIAYELRDTLASTLRISSRLAMAIVFVSPLVFVLIGLKDFVIVVSLAGGVCLALQYFCIVWTARRALYLSAYEQVASSFALLVFSSLAIYELSRFVIH